MFDQRLRQSIDGEASARWRLVPKVRRQIFDIGLGEVEHMRRLVGGLAGRTVRRCLGGAVGCALSLFGQVAVADRANLNYDVDAALTYLDALTAPRNGVGSIGAASGGSPLAAAAQPRAPGLRRFALGLSYQASPIAGMHFVLRPDAVNRHDEAGGTQLPVREVDTRSGDRGLQPMPTLRLLDEYQLVLRPRPAMSLGIGVWSGLQPAEQAYPELLGFGLKVLFPAKFSGLRLTWQPQSQEPDRAGASGVGAKPAGVTAELSLFQGNEDRAEALVAKHDTFDVAPSARDPYYGTALRVAARPGQGVELILLLGFLDQQDGQGRYDEVFAQVGASQVFAALGRQAKVSFEARYLRSRGRVQTEPQTLQSGSLSASVAVAQDLWGLVGIDFGKGDRWTSDVRRDTSKSLYGYELEAGILGHIAEELSVQLLFSREYRTARDASGKSGGFQDGTGNRSGLSRMGLELTYQLNKNA